jgi:predicted CXXCH cytochrome family protein
MNKYKISVIILLIILFYGIIYTQSIKTSKHNLSSGGPGSIKATSESEICIFCHTPHSSGAKLPLWNRNDPASTYQLYTSSTKNATIGQPDGESLMCLSCHDGTVALGSVISRSSAISFGSIVYMPAGSSKLGTDLRDDHPISFIYNASLASADGQLKNPTSITTPVHLDGSGKLQCTSCHDPHKSTFNSFLHLTNENSELCSSCHIRTNWASSTHKSSTKTWNGSGTNPWQHTTFTTVAKNGCENCHNPHSANGTNRLLNSSVEETNCLNCHNGNVASTNINAQLNKTYRHNVSGYSGVHDPTENSLVSSKHVECVDCHDPHQSDNITNVTPPNVKGYNKGVKGIDNAGNSVNPVNYEYQICYKCHTTSSWRPGSPTTRQIAQNNVQLEFNSSNPSFHPIEVKGVNSNVPSLISPWTTNSIMYCSSCHASDGTSAPAGPHGSTIPQILKKQFIRTDPASYSTSNYALCFECHNSSKIVADKGPFNEYHKKHIRDENTSCNVCHDPHGISSTQGNSTNNSKLINFNTNVVTPNSAGKLYFEKTANGGRCYLKCHNENHNPESYTSN